MSIAKCITKTISVIINASLLALSAFLLTQANPTRASAAFVGGCQCTDYVYSQRTDIPRGMGNARDWISSAARRGYSYDQVPQVGDVAVFLNGSHGFSAAYGHVAMVTWVNDSHTQFNIAGWDGLKADCILQSFSNLTVRADDWFIHQGGAPSPPPAPPSSPQPSTGGIEFRPVSPVRAGETVNITVKVQPGSDFRSARLLIDYQVVSESAATEFSYSWNTSGFLPSVHNIRLEIATREDTNWAHPYSYEATYLLRESVQAQNRSPNTPSQISPADGQTITENGQLCWHNNGDPNGDPVKTRAEVWGAGSWISPWLEGDDPCWTLPGTVGGEYSWAVRARDSKGAESGASSPWAFTIQPTETINQPAPIDTTDPVAIAAWFNQSIRLGDVAPFEYFVPDYPNITGDHPYGPDVKCYENMGEWCDITKAKFVAEVSRRIRSVDSCFYYSGTTDYGDNYLAIQIGGWNPEWSWPWGNASDLNLHFDDYNSAMGEFVIDEIYLERFPPPNDYNKPCP